MIDVEFSFRDHSFVVTELFNEIKIYVYSGQYSVDDLTLVKDPLASLVSKAKQVLSDYKIEKGIVLADRHNDDPDYKEGA